MRLVTIINTHNGICTTHMLSTNASRALMCRTTRLPIFFAFAVAIVVALQFGLFLCQKNLNQLNTIPQIHWVNSQRGKSE